MNSFGNVWTLIFIYTYLTHDSPYDVVGFTVDRDYMQQESLFGLPLFLLRMSISFSAGWLQMLVSLSYQQVNKLRAAKYYEAKDKGYELISYISSKP